MSYCCDTQHCTLSADAPLRRAVQSYRIRQRSSGRRLPWLSERTCTLCVWFSDQSDRTVTEGQSVQQSMPPRMQHTLPAVHPSYSPRIREPWHIRPSDNFFVHRHHEGSVQKCCYSLEWSVVRRGGRAFVAVGSCITFVKKECGISGGVSGYRC